MNPRRLYRCRQDRWLAGVAGGMAEYLEVDPTVVRILWILSAFLGGFTILLYIILVFIIPLEPLPMPGAPWGSGAPWGHGPQWGPGAMPGTAAGPSTPASGSAAGGSAAGDAEAATTGWDPAATAGAAEPGSPGSTTPPAWTAPAGWQPGGWAAHRHGADSGPEGRGRAGLFIGIVLVVFGAIALAGALVPAWTAVGLGPAFVVALGVALIVAATRRPAAES